MAKVIFNHLYVIVMAFLILTSSQIVALHYGDDILDAIQSLLSSADNEVIEIQDSVTDWNKKILD